MAKPKRRATYDDLLRLPEHVVGEIVNGELIATPRPSAPHALASSIIGVDLGGAFNRPPGSGAGPGGWWSPGGWWIIDEPELHLGADVLVPDLAGWRRERMPRVPNTPAFELPPDWVCEVISPSTERTDRALKMGIYARVSVANVWLVNPLAQTLEVYVLDGGLWKLLGIHSGTDRVRAVPFDAVELDISRWWLEGEPPAPPSSTKE